MELQHFENVGKGGARQIPKIRLIFLKGRIWNQYYPENTKWECGDLGSRSSNNTMNVSESLDSDTLKIGRFDRNLCIFI